MLGRVHDVLSGKDATEDFAHLSAADRQAILDILPRDEAGTGEAVADAVRFGSGRASPKAIDP